MIDPFNNPDDLLLDEVYQEMLKVAFRFFRNKADALDVVQESWVKILVKMDSLQDERKFIEWAKAIVHNTAINELKKRARREWIEKKCIPFQSPVQHEEQMTANLQWLDLLRQVHDRDTRQILIYKFKYDWKDQQIARQLDCPMGTVKSKLHRYKNGMRKEMVSTSNS